MSQHGGPYTSNNDNPILYKDPRGNEGEACCGIVQLGEDALDIYRAVRGGENILDATKGNSTTWKSVINGIGKAIEFDQGGLIKVDPKDLPINKDSKTATAPPQSVVLTLPADTKVNTSKLKTGSYTNTHKSNKRYHGKGSKARAAASGKRIAKIHDDPLVSTDHTESKDDREAYKDESRRLENDGTHKNNDNYNQRDSPGTNYRKQDGDK